jgi:hypothetical protein
MGTFEIQQIGDGVERVRVHDGAGGFAEAEVVLDAARISALTGLSVANVDRTVLLTKVEGSSGLVPSALYAALARGRLAEKATVLAALPHADVPVARLARLEPLSGSELLAQTLDVASFQCFEQADEPQRELMRSGFAQEIVDSVERWAPRFFQGPWAKAVLARTLSRQQYIQTLSNMHQYVRFTTRLLGRAVAISPTTDLRNHYLGHLSGEVNHEIIIERDLKYLGANVDYVMKHRVPNAATRAFMVTQQSMIAFEQHPILFMACPLSAEGITAHLNQEFLDGLRACVQSFGYGEPSKATMFFSSHIQTDGGDDGHWQKTIDILGTYIRSDIEQQEFLSVLRLSMDAIEQSFNSNVAELSLYSRGA